VKRAASREVGRPSSILASDKRVKRRSSGTDSAEAYLCTKRSRPRSRLIEQSSLLHRVIALAGFPKHPTSQIRNVPDRLEAKVSWGTAPEIFDTLTARTLRGGTRPAALDD